MKGLLEIILRFLLRKMQFDIVPYGLDGVDEKDRKIVDRVKPFTMTSADRVVAFCDSVSYATRAGIPGAIVECGVWKGGSMMAAALKLLEAGSTERTLWLYDTFTGMSAPTDADYDIQGNSAASQLAVASQRSAVAANSPLGEVQASMASVGYPESKIKYCCGMVENTIPRSIPDQIAVLRLDTDWYESTRHELVHLYPRLAQGGVLIIDDYGHWQGARKAVDEYLSENNIQAMLHRIDYSGRIMIKPS